jgi:hypothetical protein
VGFALVNRSLLSRHACNFKLRFGTRFDASVALNPQSTPIVRRCSEMLLTVQACTSFGLRARGRKGSLAMIEMVTAVMGLVGAGIFIAHAFEGVLSRT